MSVSRKVQEMKKKNRSYIINDIHTSYTLPNQWQMHSKASEWALYATNPGMTLLDALFSHRYTPTRSLTKVKRMTSLSNGSNGYNPSTGYAPCARLALKIVCSF